jgi:type II secretory pathway component PulJ
MKRARSGFTLIEVLLASIIAVVLIGGMLLMLSSLARDRARLQARTDVQRSDRMLELLRWDLANASKVSSQTNLLTLEGYGGIDRAHRVGTNRAARVVYRVRRDGVRSALVREQRFVDDPISAQPWTEMVANGATRLIVTSSASPDGAAAADASSTTVSAAPALVRVRVEFADHLIDRELRIR